jgi:hypothetical protein
VIGEGGQVIAILMLLVLTGLGTVMAMHCQREHARFWLTVSTVLLVIAILGAWDLQGGFHVD